MGTHPIFESDFDCLTECQIGVDFPRPSCAICAAVEMHLLPNPPHPNQTQNRQRNRQRQKMEQKSRLVPEKQQNPKTHPNLMLQPCYLPKKRKKLKQPIKFTQ